MIYWDRIDARAARLLRSWPAKELLRRFYLSGGTALALQLGHRTSVDLDFFTKKPSSRLQGEAIVQQLERHFPTMTLSHRALDQLEVDLAGVKVTFLAYPSPRKYPFLEIHGISLADARDIGLQKAFALGRRATARDYIDLAWLLQTGILSIKAILEQAQEVFVMGGEKLFSPKLFLQQLLYTEDLEDLEASVRKLSQQETFEDLMEILREAVRREIPIFGDRPERQEPDS